MTKLEVVCPKPAVWHEIYQTVLSSWRERGDAPKPPVPLVLAGWAFSNDDEKRKRWLETVFWAARWGYAHNIRPLTADELYRIPDMPTAHAPARPVFLTWNTTARPRPTQALLDECIARIRKEWVLIAAADIAAITRPLRFTGRKRRRLLVQGDPNAVPPWGSWSSLGPEPVRSSFRHFRQRINEVISPHEIDHIDFELTLR